MTGITCGRCTHWANGRRIEVKHNTIEEVRLCAQGNLTGPSMSDAEETRLVQARERAEDEAVAAYKAQRDASLVRNNPSGAIAGKVWEQVRALQDTLPNLPHMRYAIEAIDFEKSPEPVWKFYQIDKPTKGKWAGRTFVNVMASDDKYPVRKPESLITILTAIAHDPEKAASDYGHQIGKCGICQRTLTDPESINRGIGPVCAGKAGW